MLSTMVRAALRGRNTLLAVCHRPAPVELPQSPRPRERKRVGEDGEKKGGEPWRWREVENNRGSGSEAREKSEM